MTFEEITRQMYILLYQNEKVSHAKTDEQKKEFIDNISLLCRDLQASFQAE